MNSHRVKNADSFAARFMALSLGKRIVICACFAFFFSVLIVTFLFASWLQGLPSVANAEDYTKPDDDGLCLR